MPMWASMATWRRTLCVRGRAAGGGGRGRFDRGGGDGDCDGVSADPWGSGRGPVGAGGARRDHAGGGDRSGIPRGDKGGDDEPGRGAGGDQGGERIAQLRIVQRIEASFEEVAELGEAARGAGGFGSTGK